jgi:hypothetical protein
MGDQTTLVVNTADAFEIVLDLAKQNVIQDPDMAEEKERQEEAIRTVEDFVVNQLGDD